MLTERRRLVALWLPAFAASLFVSRLIGEWSRPSLVGAVFITLVTVLLASAGYALAVRRRPVWLRRLRPGSAILLALVLLLYVFYPEPDPRIAVLVLALALAFTLLHSSAFFATSRSAGAATLLLIGAGFLALYGRTLAPGLLPADSGELQLVAATLGVAHPPGFPLYTLLAHVFTLIPVGPTAAFRVNLLSAIVAVGALLLTYAAVVQLTRQRLAGIVAVLALGTSTTFWAQATTANIRSLTVFFAALAFYALLRIRNAQRIAGSQGATSLSFVLFAGAIGFGIVHHASLFFMSVVMLIYLFLVAPRFWHNPTRLALMALAALLALGPLLYLPLRANADVPGATAGLATFNGFLDHVLARGFQGDFFYYLEPRLLWERLRVMGTVLTFQFHPLLLASALVGWLFLLWRDRRVALLIGGTFAVQTLVTAVYRAPQSVEYMLPAYLPVVIALGYAFARLLLHLPLSLAGPAKLAAAFLLVAAVYQGVQNWPSYSLLATDETARDYAEAIFAQAPDEALILSDWHWISPMRYLQEVEQRRPDLEVRYVFPASDPYGDTWAQRIAAGSAQDREVIATHFDPGAYAVLPPPEPLASAFWFRQKPRLEVPPGYAALDTILGDAVRLLGFDLSADDATPGTAFAVSVAWEPTREGAGATGEAPGVTFFAHLVGPDGVVYAQTDQPVRAPVNGIGLVRLALTPRLETPPGVYSLQIGAYRSTDGAALPAAGGEVRVPAAPVTVRPMSIAPATHQRAYRATLLPGERILIGYDWDNTLPASPRLYRHWHTPAGFFTDVETVAGGSAMLPNWYGPWGVTRSGSLRLRQDQYYVPFGQGIIWRGRPVLDGKNIAPGEELLLPAHFLSSLPIISDQVVSVRLIGYEPDGFHWAWWDLQDSVPALGAIPTLKWIRGSAVRDPHLLTAAATATPGQQVGGLLRLYDAFTAAPLPILDARIVAEYLGVPLGTAMIGGEED